FRMLPASCVLAATSYLSNSRVLRVLTILTTVLTVGLSRTLTRTMCTLLVICHKTPPAFLDRDYLLVSSHARTAALSGQAIHGASRITIVRRRSPRVSRSGLSN